MERLKKVIEQHGRWSGLSLYMDHIKAHVSTDFSHAIENAKALLETIGKEICDSKGVEVEATVSINSLMKKAFAAIGYQSENMVTQICSALATIGQNNGEFGMGSYSFPASEILFNVDNQAYHTELAAYEEDG